MILFEADDLVKRWVEERLGASFGKSAALGVIGNKELIAGVVYHNYFPQYKNIELSIFSTTPKWATRQNIKILLSYPFNQLGCERITTMMRSSNDRAIKFNIGIGFKVEGRIRMGYGNEDMVVTGMLKKEANKWLGE